MHTPCRLSARERLTGLQPCKEREMQTNKRQGDKLDKSKRKGRHIVYRVVKG